MKNKGLLVVVAVIIFAITLMSLVGNSMLNETTSSTFKENVYINGESVRGKTRQNVYNNLSEKLGKQLSNSTLKLTYKDKEWVFNEEDMEINSAVQEVVNKAFKYNVNTVNALKGEENGNFKINAKNVYANLENKVEEIAKEIECEPVNSEVNFNPNAEPMFIVSESRVGIKLDREKLFNEIDKQFLNSKKIEIEIPVIETKAEKDEEFFSDKLNKMSEFSTDLTNSQAGRRHNVEYALSKFNGKVVKSKETISFNEVTSPQTLEGGYQNATVILNGVFTQGVGGGICQASTTLYNACVLANLQIEEVHKHTLPVGYVELSLDAMVSDGYADFIFTNTSDYDVYIKTFLKGDRAYVEIYGKTIPDGYSITRGAEFIGNIPHRGDKIVPDTDKQYTNKVIYKGEYYRLKYPREGYEAKGYKNTYKDGELIKREEIRHEKYQPIDGIIIEGVEDLPEGFVLPESDVEIIKPQTAETKIEGVAQKIKNQNPTRFAL